MLEFIQRRWVFLFYFQLIGIERVIIVSIVVSFSLVHKKFQWLGCIIDVFGFKIFILF